MKMYFSDEHPIILSIIITILVMLLVAFLVGLGTGFKSFHYEYETIDGDKGAAKNCWIQYGESSCRLEDGTYIYNLKSTKRVIEE